MSRTAMRTAWATHTDIVKWFVDPRDYRLLAMVPDRFRPMPSLLNRERVLKLVAWKCVEVMADSRERFVWQRTIIGRVVAAALTEQLTAEAAEARQGVRMAKDGAKVPRKPKRVSRAGSGPAIGVGNARRTKDFVYTTRG